MLRSVSCGRGHSVFRASPVDRFSWESDAHRPRAAATALHPGHNKWDYDYSVGVERPDVIVQTWRATPADIRLIRSLGYEPVGRDAFVRSGISNVAVKQLSLAFAAFDRTAPTSVRPQR
jgi:hypothetical protein